MRKTILVMAMAIAMALSTMGAALAAPGDSITDWDTNGGAVTDGSTIVMDITDDTVSPFGASIENPAYGTAGEAGTPVEISFTFEITEGDARCDQGAPRVFVRSGDEVVFASGGQSSSTCPGDADPREGPVTVTGTVDGGDLGHVGLVFDNVANRSVAEFTRFSIDGVELLVPAPTSKDDCKNGGWESYDFKNQGQCIASIVANDNAGK